MLIYFVFDFLLKCDPIEETHRKKKLMEAQKLCVDYQIRTKFSKQHTIFHIILIDMFNMHGVEVVTPVLELLGVTRNSNNNSTLTLWAIQVLSRSYTWAVPNITHGEFAAYYHLYKG